MQMREMIHSPSFTPAHQKFVEQTLGVPMIAHPRKITSGSIHATYAIQTLLQESYLKIRGETHTEPHDSRAIANEWRALLLFRKYVPDVFPEVLGFNQEENALLLLKIPGVLALEVFTQGNITDAMCLSIGQTIGKAHRLLATIPQSEQMIHQTPEKAQQMAQYLLAQRLFRMDYPTINSLGISLLFSPNKQWVPGDLQTKNIILGADDSVGIIDLEFAHNGHVLHDLSHLLGEVILRTVHEANPSHAAQIILTGYLQENSAFHKNDPFLLKLILASMLFQLDVADISDIKGDKTILRSMIHSLLDENITQRRNNLSWDMLEACLTSTHI